MSTAGIRLNASAMPVTAEVGCSTVTSEVDSMYPVTVSTIVSTVVPSAAPVVSPAVQTPLKTPARPSSAAVAWSGVAWS